MLLHYYTMKKYKKQQLKIPYTISIFYILISSFLQRILKANYLILEYKEY